MDGWKRKSVMHLESDCGKFAICKVLVRARLQYELWSMVDKKMLHNAKSVIDCVRRFDELKEAR